ncbi:hypothetical protein HDV05_005046 [Chytridiales sp. JEL 0842]|nr:hypothetical protein HDV05_005046 [Chytridiales sp. JEL 0842]
MAKVPLGKNGPLVSPIGFGAMGLSEFYGPADEEENLKVLNHAIDIGCTFWDTADVYGMGANEKLIAKILKTRRDEVFLCTKFGIVRGTKGEFLGVDGSPEYIKKCCQASLDRLETPYIDLYYQHRVDPKTPIETTVKAMAELVKEGKVKYLGLSEASAATIRRAHAVHPITAVQVEYSPWSLDIEQNDILKTCEELGIAVVPYSPLGRGFLTGQIRSPSDFGPDDYRQYQPRFQRDAFYKNLALVDALKKLAEKKGITAAQLTLAWVKAQGVCMISIPGTKKISRLEENFAAKDVVITEEDNQAVREILKTIPVIGQRYNEAGMRSTNL